MINFETGTPIAKINDPYNKKRNGLVIKLDANTQSKNNNKNDLYDIFGEDKILKYAKSKRMNNYEKETLEHWLYEDEEPEDSAIKSRFSDIKTQYESANDKEFITHSGNLVPLPLSEKGQRDVIYISAPSGSGKSTWCRMYINEYKKMFPKNRVILFSRVNKDESIDPVKPVRIMLNNEIVDDPIKSEELKNSLCIFDDCDTIQDKDIKAAIIKLRNDLLETGRHTNTYMLITSHLLMNYKETRTVLNEATKVVVFPASGSSYHIQRFFKEYAGMNKTQVQKALSLPSRWVCLSKVFPQYILYSNGIYLLNS